VGQFEWPTVAGVRDKFADAWRHLPRRNRRGFIVAACLSVLWLGLIVADGTWWLLTVWPFAVAMGLGAWLVTVPPREDASVEQTGDIGQ
jgi:hypothetical protein